MTLNFLCSFVTNLPKHHSHHIVVLTPAVSIYPLCLNLQNDGNGPDFWSIHHRARWASEDTTVLDLDTNELSPLKCSCSWRVFQQVEPFFCLKIRNRIQNTKSIKIYANIQTSADSIFDLIFFCSPLLPFDGFARLRVPMGEGTIELSDSGHTAH